MISEIEKIQIAMETNNQTSRKILDQRKMLNGA